MLVGTLVVDISDARKGAIVWRSQASSDIGPTRQAGDSRPEDRESDRQDVQELPAEAVGWVTSRLRSRHPERRAPSVEAGSLE